ncbi:hypothetical protein P3X46_015846 [Hevea brasiliensis]|uniref:F-box domain-containing protein n=1 Tax=Hevea brasiliensis TaxID=3981 RepID=A0ABQ9LXD9_HEVBR|nr:F-box protein CPR1 [Hevea brasiliensis]KAJ9172631.1 hypothetical protein P3X46_015846 [Hevea brasiliensis]
MSHHIPPEIVIEILIRAPVQTLIRCRSVSKQWRATIDDPDFIKRQINHSFKTSTNNTLFIKEEYGQQFFDYDFDCSGSCVSMEFRDLPNSSLTRSFSIVGSSNGLICLRNESNDDILIVNPSTRKHQWMPGLLPLKFHSCVNLTWDGTGFRGSGYGFGYDRVSDDYKIVRIAQVHNPANDGFLESEVLICKVKTKIVRAVKIPFVVPTSHRMAVLVNEALHWIAFRYDDPRVSDVIVVYDLVTDEFREYPLPKLVDDNRFGMDFGLLGTRLCLFVDHEDDGVDAVWVMKEYGVKESWTELFSISYTELKYAYVRPLGFSKRRLEVLLELDGNRLVWYDIEKKKAEHFVLHGLQMTHFTATILLRSLAPVPADTN